jgi:predicted HTH domain antitoxin
LGKLNINIPVSEEILFILKKDEASFQKEILKMLALQFFIEKKLSLGKASELAGMDKNDFVELLGQHSIDIYRYSERELERELNFISQLS